MKGFVSRLLTRASVGRDGALPIRDPRVIEEFVSDPENPFLVSFPRTGSHWLRMLMELYFKRPSLTLVFYLRDRSDYMTLHTHDLDLDLERRNVIYLYRDPVDTVFSRLHKLRADVRNRERAIFHADLYGRHLDKWLFKESFTIRKTVLRYEAMRADLPHEFARLCAHFGQELNPGRLQAVAARATKGEVMERVKHDNNVIRLDDEYSRDRDLFRSESGKLVWETLLREREYLGDLFRSTADG